MSSVSFEWGYPKLKRTPISQSEKLANARQGINHIICYWQNLSKSAKKSISDASTIGLGANRVLIIFRNAPMEFVRVTIWARPVDESVTTMTGQPKARKASKFINRCPHERSYLLKQHQPAIRSSTFEDGMLQSLTMKYYRLGSSSYRLSISVLPVRPPCDT